MTSNDDEAGPNHLLQPFSAENSTYDYFCLINNQKTLSPKDLKQILSKFSCLGPKIQCKSILHHHASLQIKCFSNKARAPNFHHFYQSGLALGKKLASKRSGTTKNAVLLVDLDLTDGTLKYFPKYGKTCGDLTQNNCTSLKQSCIL